MALLGSGVGEPVGIGPGFDDVAAEGEPVDGRAAEPWIGERFRPARECNIESGTLSHLSRSRFVHTRKTTGYCLLC